MHCKHFGLRCLLANYLEQLRDINIWKGSECSDYLVNLSWFLEGLLFSHYSWYLLSCHLLAKACVVADWMAWNKTENHSVTFTRVTPAGEQVKRGSL